MPPPTAARRLDASAAPVFAYQTVTVAVGSRRARSCRSTRRTSPRRGDGCRGSPVSASLARDRLRRVTRARHLRDEPRPTHDHRRVHAAARRSTRSRAPCCWGSTTKAIPAEVLEQAVVGSIRIVEGDRKFFGGVKLKAAAHRSVAGRRRRPAAARTGLFPFLRPRRGVRVRKHRHAILGCRAEHPQDRESRSSCAGGSVAMCPRACGRCRCSRRSGPRPSCSSRHVRVRLRVDPLIPILLIVGSGSGACSS